MAFNDGRVISNFVVQALMGEPLTVYGDGSQTRSFCYVDDLIDGLVRLMTFEGADSKMGPRESGRWSPYSRPSVIWLSSDTWGESIWEPAFAHDGALLLTTPSFEPDAVSTVTLRRAR